MENKKEEDLKMKVVKISPLECYNCLQQIEISTLIIDSREFALFKESHLRCSICMRFEKLDDLDTLEFNDPISKYVGRFRSRRSKKRFILYGDNDMNEKIISVIRDEKLKCVVMILEDYGGFCKKYPFLVTTPSKPSLSKDLPAEIVDSFIWLGGKFHAFSEELLKILRISHIINPTEELANKFEEDEETDLKIEYFPKKSDVLNNKNLGGIGDTVDDSIMEMLLACLDFLERAKKDGGRVLVHCNMGISRSSSIVIAWLMKHEKMGYHEAKKYVKDRRTIIKPNPTFEKELLKWGKEFENEKV